ncbi:MAG: hypothetical protein AAGK32_17050, partial [Actinomycetota bacterium]
PGPMPVPPTVAPAARRTSRSTSRHCGDVGQPIDEVGRGQAGVGGGGGPQLGPRRERSDRLAHITARPDAGSANRGAGRTADEPVDIEALRLAADDLRTWYLHAAAQQPGRAGSHERNTWFWRETALAHLLGHVAAALLDHPDRRVAVFAQRGIVPRDHWDLLVPHPTQETSGP